MSQVDYERSGIDRLMGNYAVFEALVRHVRDAVNRGRPTKNFTMARDKLADIRVQFDVRRLLVYRTTAMLSQGKAPNVEPAVARLYGRNLIKDWRTWPWTCWAPVDC